nr:NADH dehydrogenase subunit 3 [Merostenus sp.]
MIMMLVVMMLIVLIMLMMNLILSKKSMKNREKISPFECGFDPMVMNRLPFSLQFYLISIIFLIFDVEISLILPMLGISIMNFYSYLWINLSVIMIIIILVGGLFLEWFEGALIWFK